MEVHPPVRCGGCNYFSSRFSSVRPQFRAADWELVKYAGRDHVALENVAQFYNLGGVQRVGNTLTLASAGRSLRGAVGSNEFTSTT